VDSNIDLLIKASGKESGNTGEAAKKKTKTAAPTGGSARQGGQRPAAKTDDNKK